MVLLVYNEVSRPLFPPSKVFYRNTGQDIYGCQTEGTLTRHSLLDRLRTIPVIDLDTNTWM